MELELYYFLYLLLVTSLFSAFDPSVIVSDMILPLNWFSLFFTILLLSWDKFLNPCFHNKVHEVVLNLFLTKNLSIVIVLSLFFYIYLNNVLSLTPGSFSCTSHLVFNLFLALPLWISSVKILFYTVYRGLSHLVPSGSPIILAPFLFFIELVSLIIRPLSLSIRLIANMLAGHFIITLLSDMVSKSFFLLGLGIFTSMMFVVETGVSLVQAYVFTILLNMYILEGKKVVNPNNTNF